MERAYATMVCNGDAYVPGAEVLARSLQASRTREPLLAMVTPDVSAAARARLAAQGWTLRDIDPLRNPNPGKLLYPRFEHVFPKLRAWQLDEVDKLVFLDADTVVLKNIDELFERPSLAAAPDFLLPDRFNSGVMVLSPSQQIFEQMMKALGGAESYDGGDQGFLNTFFSSWYAMPVEHRLPAGFNIHHFIFQFLRGHTALKRSVEREAKIIHYAVQKPWNSGPLLTGGSEAWWSLYYDAHPEKDRAWRRRLHALEDWTFDHVVDAFLA